MTQALQNTKRKRKFSGINHKVSSNTLFSAVYRYIKGIVITEINLKKNNTVYPVLDSLSINNMPSPLK